VPCLNVPNTEQSINPALNGPINEEMNMPKNQTPDITLTMAYGTNSSPGWKNTTVSGTAYSYLFQGGNDGAGGITGKKNKGAVDVSLTVLDAPSDPNSGDLPTDSSISAVSFFTVTGTTKTPYTGKELDWNPDNPAPVTSGKIKDKMDNVQDYYYSVSILDSTQSPANTIVCDPPIKNITN
jgi:hypothetical protein